MSLAFENGSDPYTELHNPSLDVFRPSERDTSILEYEYVQLMPSTGIPLGQVVTNFQSPVYEFLLQDLNSWYNLSEAVVECHFSIVRSDNGANFVLGDQISYVNNSLNLWKRVEYTQNNVKVDDCDYPGIVEQVKGLVYYNPDAETLLSHELWSPDRGNGSFNFNNTYKLQFFNNLGQEMTVQSSAAGTLLIVANGGANASGITVQMNGLPVIAYINNTGAATALVNNGGANGRIAYAGLANGDRVFFYVGNTLVTLFDSFGNAYTNMTATTGGGNGLVLGGYIQAQNPVSVNGSVDINNQFSVNSTVTRKTNFNSGLFDRMNKQIDAAGNYTKQYSCFIPLRKLFPYLDFNRIVLKGMEHRFKLYVNDQSRMMFRTNAGTNVDGRLIYNYLLMWVPRVKPSERWSKILQDQMSQGLERNIGFNRFSYYIRSDPINDQNPGRIQWTIPTTETRPRKVFLLMQRQDYDRNQLQNPMIFPAQPVSKCFIRFNNGIYPEYPHEAQTIGTQAFPDNVSYERMYFDLVRSGHKQFTTSNPPAITYEEFVKLYYIITFDLSKIDDEKLYKNMNKSHMDIDISFSGNLVAYNGVGNSPYILHFIVESESYCKLQSSQYALVPKN